MGLYSFLKPSFGFTDIWGNDWAWRLGKRDRRVTKPQAPNYYTIEVLVKSYGGQFTLLVWPHHHSFRPSTKFQVITEGSATRNQARNWSASPRSHLFQRAFSIISEQRRCFCRRRVDLKRGIGAEGVFGRSTFGFTKNSQRGSSRKTLSCRKEGTVVTSKWCIPDEPRRSLWIWTLI